jgi:Tol biopolymer transport system component
MVTYGDNYIHSPRWSHDRSQIAYLAYRSGIEQVHIMDLDGDNNRQLTFESDLDTEGMVVLPDGSRDIRWLIWLPDGNRVAVALEGYEQLIWQTVDVVTGEIAPLDDLVLPSSQYIRFMSVSHDGKRVAYTAPINLEGIDSPVEIFIQDLDGSTPFQLTNTGWEIRNPVWSPDDSQIAFLSSSEYGTENNYIYTINLDGSNLHEPFLTDINPWRLAWSPDGKSLAIVAGEMITTGDIFYPEKQLITLNTINIRTSERIILFQTESPNDIYDLSW